jgi:hypothetical protein
MRATLSGAAVSPTVKLMAASAATPSSTTARSRVKRSPSWRACSWGSPCGTASSTAVQMQWPKGPRPKDGS